MMKNIHLFLLICTVFQLPAQIHIEFKVNMQTLVDSNLFTPASGERVFVRGNFCNWQGDKYELGTINEDNLFSGTFILPAAIGDTLEYKFIIRKKEGQIYWERNPNPGNSDYGNRQLIITDSTLTVSTAIFDYDEFIRYPVIFSQEKLREDFMQMQGAVEESHPALYDYTDKRTLDSLFRYYYQQIDRDLEFNEFYQIASSALARIGCGHTKLWIPADYWAIAPRKLFPLQVIFSTQSVLVSGFYSRSGTVPLGSEITFINGMPVREVIETLKSTASSDGFIESFKEKTVEKNFPQQYALSYGYPDTFRITYIAPGESSPEVIEISPVGIETVNERSSAGSQLSLKLWENTDTALLTIRSFIGYDQVEKFRSFIDSSFQVIKNEKISNLIIDLRGNGGGDPFSSSHLLSYIERQPVPYFAAPYGKYAELAESVPLAENHFKGKIFTLIDGSGFSTTGHFCALLKYHKIGRLVGSETGATFTCTGSVRYLNLKHTRLILGTARKRRYTAAVTNMDRTRGVAPDYQVEQTQRDLVAGRDTVLEFTRQLLGDLHRD